MASRGLKMQQSSGRQIVIEQQSDDHSEVERRYKYYEGEGDFKHNYYHQKNNEKLMKNEGIKINKDKLLRYDPLNQKKIVDNSTQNVGKVHKIKYGQGSKVISELALNKSASIKTLKMIKHKIALSKRLKTQENKQNELQPFLPKMHIRNKNENQKMNKTTSAINFKQINQSNSVRTKEDLNKTFLNSCLSKNKMSQIDKSQQNDKFAIKKQLTNRSSSRMRQTYNKSSSVTRFKNFETAAQGQIVCNYQQVMNILNDMGMKEEKVFQEKKHLQERILALRNGIEKQTSLIYEINNNKRRISSNMIKKQHISKYSKEGANFSKKKSENYQTQAKNLQYSLSETNQINNRVIASIEEEKQLIRMYEVVIEEVKCQLKQEKQQKLQLQKKLAQAKKNEKSIQSKLTTQQATSRQIFRKIYFSLEKWQ